VAAVSTAIRDFLRRGIGAARLDARVYEEVEADRGANGQAALMVALSAAGAGLGSFGNHGLGGVVWYTLAALASWYVWAAIAYLIGTRWLPAPETRADHGELLRTIGFSSAPGVLRILGLFAPIASFVFLVSTVWMLVAMVIGVRQALDYCTTRRAVAVCAIGFPVYAVALALSLFLLGPWPM
jgi:hypothetical protein